MFSTSEGAQSASQPTFEAPWQRSHDRWWNQSEVIVQSMCDPFAEEHPCLGKAHVVALVISKLLESLGRFQGLHTQQDACGVLRTD